jgi:hypothetical protein
VSKDRIFFHRSYRTIPGLGAGAGIDLLALIVPLELFLLLFYQPLLHGVVHAVRWILALCGIESTVVYQPFLPFVIEQIPVLDAATVFPGERFAQINLIVALFLTLVLPLLRFIPRPLTVYVIFVSLINAVSAGFFLLVPHLFPYDMVAFTTLYLQMALGLWILLPLLVAVALGPLPGTTISKFGVAVFTLLYSMLFGTVRLAVFVYLLTRFSVMYMAAMFFALGPFIDFVYVVAIYAIYLNLLSLRMRERPEAWQWLS